MPVSFAQALELGRKHYGEVPLEKVELKDEGGSLIYKVCRGEGHRRSASTRTPGR